MRTRALPLPLSPYLSPPSPSLRLHPPLPADPRICADACGVLMALSLFRYFYGTREGELGKLEAGPNARFDQIANGM